MPVPIWRQKALVDEIARLSEQAESTVRTIASLIKAPPA
jgi:hypothetical protein